MVDDYLNYSHCIALRDIAEDIRNSNQLIFSGNGKTRDIWVVLPSMLQNKEIRRLNAELGLRSINRNKENMSRIRKNK
jgi:hypothetical protein